MVSDGERDFSSRPTAATKADAKMRNVRTTELRESMVDDAAVLMLE